MWSKSVTPYSDYFGEEGASALPRRPGSEFLYGITTDPVRNHPYRPVPDEGGNLLVDPEIELNAKAFPLNIGFYFFSPGPH